MVRALLQCGAPLDKPAAFGPKLPLEKLDMSCGVSLGAGCGRRSDTKSAMGGRQFRRRYFACANTGTNETGSDWHSASSGVRPQGTGQAMEWRPRFAPWRWGRFSCRIQAQGLPRRPCKSGRRIYWSAARLFDKSNGIQRLDFFLAFFAFLAFLAFFAFFAIVIILLLPPISNYRT